MRAETHRYTIQRFAKAEAAREIEAWIKAQRRAA